MTYQVKRFADGQITARITRSSPLVVNLKPGYDGLFEAAAIKEAWDSMGTNKGLHAYLLIPCLIGQRSDRRFSSDSSFDLKVVADFINSMGFDRVEILDPHSDVAPALINKSKVIKPTDYVRMAVGAIHDIRGSLPTNILLISPDAGAYKKVAEIADSSGLDVVPANKYRVDGEPKIIIQGDVADRDCLIVDDIADGGRTFIEIAKSLRQSGARSVYLYVTHGMFHYGFSEIQEHIDRVFCTNSYRKIDHEFVTQFDCGIGGQAE